MNKIINKNTNETLREAVNTICDAVKVTLGPKGKNVLIINNYGDAHLTKDGITVAKNVKSDDPVINGIINVVREASNNTAKTAGDGPQPLYSKIITPSGPVKLEDIQVGDIICGTNGTSQKVLGVFDKGILEVYEVKTSDGRTVQCSGNHLWTVKVHSGKEYTLTTKQLFKDYTKKKNGYNIYKYYIPNTFVEFERKDFIINPYFLGVLLGDGCLRDNGSIEIQIGYSKKHILDKLDLPNWIITTIQDVPLRNSLRVKFKGVSPENKSLRDYLEDLGLRNTTSKDKFIPKSYLYSSKNQREQLLQGLIDTDGHFSDRGLIQFSTVSKQLFEDVITLMRSLGKTMYTDIRNNTPEKGCYSYSTIYRISELKGYKHGLKITNITKTGNFQPMRCIKVENSNHLYITDNFVSTHNTTTSLVLTQSLFNLGLKALDAGHNPTMIKYGMDDALNKVIKFIEDNSEKIDINDDKLFQVAHISANNDTVVGDIAVKAIKSVGIDGIINIEDSPTHDTYVKVTNGFSFDRGYLSPYFSNTGNKITYENPLIFLSEIEISKEVAMSLLTYANKSNKPLIIIAPEFNEAITTLLFKNFKIGAVQVCPIKSPGFANTRKNTLDDLSDYINGYVHTNNSVDPIKSLGTAETIIINNDNTSIINENPTERVIHKLQELDNLIEDDEYCLMTETYRARKVKLAGSVATIYVGATTELELKEKKDRIEDAVCAVQTALRDGISEGGGMTFVRAYHSLQKDKISAGHAIVIDSLLAPFKQLCKNNDLILDIPIKLGYDFKNDVEADLKKEGVIDPTLVLKNAITNSVGIVSNLLTTACITYVE